MSIVIDGRGLAEKIRLRLKSEISQLSRAPRLGIIEVGSDPTIESFVKIKKKVGESLGVSIHHRKLGGDATTSECIFATRELAQEVDGIIVQLPLPPSVDVDAVLAVVPPEKDVDVIGAEGVERYAIGKSDFIPPVAGAVAHILVEGGFGGFNKRKRALIIGKGRLVGAPVAQWFRQISGMIVRQVDKKVASLKEETLRADVIVSGAGVPKLITPDMVHEGVVLIDAGTSEQVGRLVGDIDPACQEKAALFTPVPGGVGPVTVAVLYENLLAATKLALGV